MSRTSQWLDEPCTEINQEFSYLPDIQTTLMPIEDCKNTQGLKRNSNLSLNASDIGFCTDFLAGNEEESQSLTSFNELLSPKCTHLSEIDTFGECLTISKMPEQEHSFSLFGSSRMISFDEPQSLETNTGDNQTVLLKGENNSMSHLEKRAPESSAPLSFCPPIKRGRGRPKKQVPCDETDIDFLSLKSNKNPTLSTLSTASYGKKMLLSIITALLQGRGPSAEALRELTVAEKTILESLARRKFKARIDLSSSVEAAAEELLKAAQAPSAKRHEENYKLVFKKGLKFLLAKFKDSIQFKGRKQELEARFFETYFADIQESTNIESKSGLSGEIKPRQKDLSNRDGLDFDQTVPSVSFTQEKNDKSLHLSLQSIFSPKLVNAVYLTTIMRSSSFYKNFMDYLDNHFVSENLKTRDSKTIQVIEKCYRLLPNCSSEKEEQLHKYIESDPKCKLPWSNSELFAAIESVKKLLKRKINKKIKNSDKPCSSHQKED